MLLTVGEDYILTARAKGLSEKYVLFKHVLKNAMLPMVTMIPLECAYLIAGNIFIEIIFSWPGIGLLTFDAIAAKDFSLLQGIVLIDALLIIIANFSADLFYSHIDPRIKVGGGNV
jgi:peptide/nickel transport system permease protein